MKTFTKEEVQTLTPEQQKAVGTMEAQRVRARQELTYSVRNAIAA